MQIKDGIYGHIYRDLLWWDEEKQIRIPYQRGCYLKPHVWRELVAKVSKVDDMIDRIEDAGQGRWETALPSNR